MNRALHFYSSKEGQSGKMYVGSRGQHIIIISHMFEAINDLIHVLLQEGIVRAKLAKVLAGYDDVKYEQSFASEASIKAVCTKLIYLVKK